MNLDERLGEELRRATASDPIDHDRILAGVRLRHRRVRQRRRALQSIAAIIALVSVLSVALSTRNGSSHRPASLLTDLARFPRDATLARLQLPRASITGTDVSGRVAANTLFALDLYAQLRGNGNGNFLFSPQGLATVLAMTAAGAKGPTYDEMTKLLHAPGETALAQQFNALNQQLLAPRTAPANSGAPLALEESDSAWAQSGFPFRRPFLATLARYYGAGVNLVDFKRDPEVARGAINAAAKLGTHGRVAELFDRGTIDQLTRLVLVDTTWFKAAWQKLFVAAGVQPFHRLDGTTVSVPMMHAQQFMSFSHQATYDSIRLPYVGGASMTMIIPSLGHLDDVERRLGPTLTEIGATEQRAELDLVMPTFRFASAFTLNKPLQHLGMRLAFEPPIEGQGADFTNITPARDLYVKDVIQKTTISVDERGTEASAASGVQIEAESRTPEYHVDRPFLIVITDDTTGTSRPPSKQVRGTVPEQGRGTMLFMGRVSDPTQH